ncbi:MAG: indolepyruvate oxidoreductase subunit beta [Thermodesulfobacteriota bacterium]
MKESVRQQIVISGVGGQGVLFVTRLLAEAAIDRGWPVFTSETHGMAQRGGTVLSHLKVGDFSSPLIRPGRADGLLVLQEENLSQHRVFLKSTGWTVVNTASPGPDAGIDHSIDADRLALGMGNSKAVNLIMLGRMVSRVKGCFCTLEDIERVLNRRLKHKTGMLEASRKALRMGHTAS